MHLMDEYKRQYRWRSWDKVFGLLAEVAGQRILDLGCGIGDQAADFIKRGARVIGIDGNNDLLNEARSRFPEHHRFIQSDIRSLPDDIEPVDGIWCSFAAAYLVDFFPVLKSWKTYLKKGGWIVLIEVDNFFGHEPMAENEKKILQNYVSDAFKKGRYDFNMGRKLKNYLKESGFNIRNELTLDDREFSFSGPATKDVITAWEKRFERMTLLQEFCGPDYQNVRNEFLSCLKMDTHRSLCKVYCCIGSC